MTENELVTNVQDGFIPNTVTGSLEIRILGTLEVRRNGTVLEFSAGRQRALLAMLALRPNEVVFTDRLIEALWDGRPPPTAAKSLQNLVVQLRRTLEVPVLVTRPSGYELSVDPGAIDAHRFAQLASEGLALVESDPASAGRVLREALALWRGDPLGDVAYRDFAEAEITRLEELRQVAREGSLDADLACGRHAELVPELEALVAVDPLRERVRGQLMLALYRSGRQADALAAYRKARVLLRDELGLEPGSELRQLEQAILTQDPALGPVGRLPPRALRSRRARASVLLGAIMLIGVASGVGALLLLGDDVPKIVPDSLVKIDARTNEIVDVVPVGRHPGPVVIVGRYVVVSSASDSTLTRVDRHSHEVVTEGTFATPRGLAVEDERHLWVVNERANEVVEVDVERMETIDRLVVPEAGLEYVAVGGGSLWLNESSSGAISRRRLPILELEDRFRLESGALPGEVGYVAGSAWFALAHSGELLRVDAASGRGSRVQVGEGPGGPPAGGFGSVWTTSADAKVWRTDAATGRVRAIIRVGELPFGLAIGAGAVWVANHDDGTISRIDPATDRVVTSIDTGFFPQWVAADDRYVWVGLSSSRWGFHD